MLESPSQTIKNSVGEASKPLKSSFTIFFPLTSCIASTIRSLNVSMSGLAISLFNIICLSPFLKNRTLVALQKYKYSISLLPVLHIAFNPLFLEEVHSTNDYAIDLIAKSNPLEGTVIKTYNQHAGNGQIGRTWFSDVGKNITLSIILYPTFLSPAESFHLSMALALACRETVAHVTQSENVAIKWPNDIYVNRSKIAGLLIQQNILGQRIQSAVLGIGLNVNQDNFPSSIPNPISIYNICKKTFDLVEIEKLLLDRFAYWYGLLKKGEISRIKREYLNQMYQRGEEVIFYKKNGEECNGELIGIDENGRLVLSIEGHLNYYSVGEISSQKHFV